MTWDEASQLKQGDRVVYTGSVPTFGTVTNVYENGIVITWEGAGSQFLNFDSAGLLRVDTPSIWYQPVHYMNSAGAGWKVNRVKVMREYSTYLLLDSGQYVPKQASGKFPYFRTYDKAAVRMVELLNVSQARAMAKFLKALDAAEALIERLNSEAPNVS